MIALAGVLILSSRSRDTSHDAQTNATSQRSIASLPTGARFTALAGSNSNRCDLGAAELRQMRNTMRLRGACCFPMDRARYAEQLHDLRAYRRSDLVPADPYDVSVRLAKRLLRYRGIDLSAEGQAVYRRAKEMSSLGGPCCCPCWRWQAFKGQAKFLIDRRHFRAARIANLWDLEEGCGGPREA